MTPEHEAVPSAEASELAEAKPKAKARKKKAAEPNISEAPEETASAEKKPKTARKTAAKKPEPSEAPAETAETAPPPEAAAKKSAKKKAVKPKAEAAEPIAEPAVASRLDSPAEIPTPAPKPPEPKLQAAPQLRLERLQKILAKAGIASRRKGEEMILAGQVQINGKVVTELGTKADPERDHIRVDGKLLQGPERIRYFVLNKPKGYVTTVSDPEGRPTVMQFFAAERERLYPVGRLDYLSEGLLLVTNDGELANTLTKAASGVEKTYLVKVAGQPTEDMLDVLRSGVVIERGRPGENTGRVRTAPARIRQVRQGDNPWYEVVIIEGRNRELRKMFEEIGHHVEKIRRVGYGPLILDLEPGKSRELEPEEVHALRLAAEGKLKKKQKKSAAAGQLPTVAGRPVRYKKPDGRPGLEPRSRVRPEFQTESPAEFKPAFRALPKAAFQPAGKREFRTGFRKDIPPAAATPNAKPPARPEFKRPEGKPAFQRAPKPAFKSGAKSAFQPGSRPSFAAKPRRTEPPATDYILPPRKSLPTEPEAEFEPRSPRPSRSGTGFNPGSKPGFRSGPAAGARPAFRSAKPNVKPGAKPSFRAEIPARPASPAAGRGAGTRPLGRYNPTEDDFVPRKTPGFRVEPVEDAPRSERSRPGGARPGFARPGGARPRSGSDSSRPVSSGGGRPFRPGTRPSTRPSSRPDDGGEAPREFRPRPARPPGAPKKFAGKRFDAAKPAPGGSNSVPKLRLGPDGQPRVKERHRNSFTGKNKGRPKPKS